MINRAINFIFIDFFALAINMTLGTALRSKICNYSWEGELQTEKTNAKESISPESWEQEEDEKT